MPRLLSNHVYAAFVDFSGHPLGVGRRPHTGTVESARRVAMRLRDDGLNGHFHDASNAGTVTFATDDAGAPWLYVSANGAVVEEQGPRADSRRAVAFAAGVARRARSTPLLEGERG